MMEWLERSLPAVVSFLFAPTTVIALSLFSLACFVASVVVASWAVRRLPADYLLHEHDGREHRMGGRVGFVLRNILGAVLLVLGLLMLVLPGQGLLTIVAALAVMSFRSKRRLEHWLLLRPQLFALVNHLRRRGGRPPLLSPEPRT
jgi:hypothetical protein